MTKIRTIKTNFTAGILSPDVLGRGDLRSYENGALELRNLFISPTGGVRRRAGTYLTAVTNTPAVRIIAFEFNTQQTYLLSLHNLSIDIYLNGALVSSVGTPWTTAQIPQLCWAQSADTLILTHPDHAPRTLTRTGVNTWVLNTLAFATVNGVSMQPFFRYAPATITIAASATTGASITLTASAAFFVTAHVNTLLRINNRQVRINTVNANGLTATATVIETLTGTAATNVWTEQAFSALRGWPTTVAFHQDRLVIGGSRDLPNRLWFSRSGDIYNFNLGTGLDDDAIEFTLLSDQVNAIRGLYSGRHLQVFTSGAEWMVTGAPLTPISLQVTRQTKVGSVSNRYIPPIGVDGATIFVARNQAELREFLYADVEQAYQSTNLSVLSEGILKDIVDIDFDATRRLVIVIMADGTFATLTSFRAEQVSAWTTHVTDGQVKSVAVVGDVTYLLVQRANGMTIERFDDAEMLDCTLDGQSVTPKIFWSGLTHLNGQTVAIIADGVQRPNQVVSDGEVVLNTPASQVTVGLPYTHTITPLPPNQVGVEGGGQAIRLVALTMRLQNTQAVRLDIGQGLKSITLPNAGSLSPPPLFSGDVKVRGYGWTKDMHKGTWRIVQSDPLAFEMLSLVTEYKIND